MERMDDEMDDKRKYDDYLDGSISQRLLKEDVTDTT